MNLKSFRPLPLKTNMKLPEDLVKSKILNSVVGITIVSGYNRTETISKIIYDYAQLSQMKKIIINEKIHRFNYDLYPSHIHATSWTIDDTSEEAYKQCLRNIIPRSLKSSPDIVYIDEIIDLDMMDDIYLGAQSGHLMLTTLPTAGVCNTIDQIISDEKIYIYEFVECTNVVLSQYGGIDKSGKEFSLAEYFIIDDATKDLLIEDSSSQKIINKQDLINKINQIMTTNKTTFQDDLLRKFNHQEISIETYEYYNKKLKNTST